MKIRNYGVLAGSIVALAAIVAIQDTGAQTQPAEGMAAGGMGGGMAAQPAAQAPGAATATQGMGSQFQQAADPAAVYNPARSTSGLGSRQRATNDPVFIAQEMLGRPTDKSITINVAPRKDLEIFYEYGTKSGSYSGKTPVVLHKATEPVDTTIEGLKGNTQYFYRLNYREPGATAFTARTERSFWTQRAPGSTYSFTVQFDPHLDEVTDEDAYKTSLLNMLADKPDFIIDVGDNTFVDKLGMDATRQAVEQRSQLQRSYFDLLTHSATMYLGLGNHEGEKGPANINNVGIMNALERKRYFPNPIPNGFYTGSSRNEELVGVREANFAWQWGDALFIVLDPYWNKPVAPELSGDWNLTLGKEQYDWLKKTLETSKAKWKFVFSHNLIGGLDMAGTMRGGIEAAKYLEWGGYNLDGTYGFDKARPGWGKPIHQLLVDNKATIFFHGHDHTYAKQDLDGIVYQAGPQPSAANTNLGNRGKEYNYVNGTVLGGVGYIRVTVSPDQVKADYVQTWTPSKETATQKNRMVADTYTIKAAK